MQAKSNLVNSLQAKWLDNEERRRKRVYEESNPSFVNPLSQEPKRLKVESKATEANKVEEEALPSSSTGPSKKQVRETENEFFVGGMRNPAVAVSRLSQVRRVGEQIHAAWLNFIAQQPQALEAAQEYGSKEAKLDEKVLGNWIERLGDLLEISSSDGITLKEAMEFPSPLNAQMWDAWRVKARDPEQCIGQWAGRGPTGNGL